MASIAHVLYCFEVLNARLNHTQTLSLIQVQDSWRRYQVEQSAKLYTQDITDDDTDGNENRESNTATEYLDNGRLSKGRNHAHESRDRLSISSPSPSTGSSTPSVTSAASSSLSAISSQSSFSQDAYGLRKTTPSPTKESQYPMFVTWNKSSSSREKILRGCIGTFVNQDLEQGLKHYALESAFEDDRFPPIAASELRLLECCVTLLTDFEPASSPTDWEIGKHGLRVSFTIRSRRYNATYLPDVAKEQGWTKAETISSLLRKAGWYGSKDEWTKTPDLSIVRYQGSKVSVKFVEWEAWHSWLFRLPGP